MDRVLRVMMAAALLLALPAWAADDEGGGGASASEEKGESRLYVAAGGVWALAAFDIPAVQGQQDTFGVDARVGYRLHPHLALEAQYQWAARYQITSGLGEHLNNVETHAGTGNAKVIIFNGPFQPYVLLGVGIINASLQHGRDRTEGTLRVGGGAQLFFTEHVGLYGEITYLKPFTALNDLNAVPIAFGGVYRF
jgi:opacity protein-like surface antigen